MKTPSAKKRKEPTTEDFTYTKWTPPVLTAATLADFHRAASIHADRNLSDPFAYSRMMLYLKRGLCVPADCGSATGAS